MAPGRKLLNLLMLSLALSDSDSCTELQFWAGGPWLTIRRAHKWPRLHLSKHWCHKPKEFQLDRTTEPLERL